MPWKLMVLERWLSNIVPQEELEKDGSRRTFVGWKGELAGPSFVEVFDEDSPALHLSSTLPNSPNPKTAGPSLRFAIARRA